MMTFCTVVEIIDTISNQSPIHISVSIGLDVLGIAVVEFPTFH